MTAICINSSMPPIESKLLSKYRTAVGCEMLQSVTKAFRLQVMSDSYTVSSWLFAERITAGDAPQRGTCPAVLARRE
jgi:hypothetical protein